MFYHIQHWHPRVGMGLCGFSIVLFPEWKSHIKRLGFTDQQAREVGGRVGKQLADSRELHGIGYRELEFRVTWGEWGPEHIQVPGNACGLDIDRSPMYAPRGGMVLSPHNVDSIEQASVLLGIFQWFADAVYLNYLQDASVPSYKNKFDPISLGI